MSPSFPDSVLPSPVGSTEPLPPNPLANDDLSLPFRLRESTFRVYEPIIARAIREYPNTLVLNPSPLRPTTASARLRDAMLALHKFRYATTIDMSLFDHLYTSKRLIVSHSDTSIIIGPRRGGHRSSGMETRINSAVKAINFAPDTWNEDDVRAICRLLSRKLIFGPVRIEPPLTPDLCTSLESTMDLSITSNPDHTLIF